MSNIYNISSRFPKPKENEKFILTSEIINNYVSTLKDVNAKLIHSENGVQSNIFLDYPKQLVSIEYSRKRAIEEFKRANNEKS